MNAELKKFLHNLKKYGIKNNIPNISEKNGNFLQGIIRDSGAKKILEIGTANWYSTIYLVDAVRKKNGHITTIEHSEYSFLEAQENFKEIGFEKNITSILGNALIEVPKLQEKFDLIFIDGMKKHTLSFFQLAQEKIKKNGIIIIDDVIKFRFKMENFYEYLEKNTIKYQIHKIDEDDGTMVIKL